MEPMAIAGLRVVQAAAVATAVRLVRQSGILLVVGAMGETGLLYQGPTKKDTAAGAVAAPQEIRLMVKPEVMEAQSDAT